ncbi:LINE-1 retrotransposable element ORF2 protein [Symbiodinium microadriaticum]|uniref:LINE-1 retrotransposable element ORF2 protein n=1 Tax=Symbiodinium microadriaticum TaxID=2951 RepID=A0A1Q9EMX0_SYMMI|nr:LINE-1 retrotransposable element ORF2 protein [Symbiodinium microadriaticum]
MGKSNVMDHLVNLKAMALQLREGQDSYYKGKRLTCDPQYNYTKMATTPASPAPRLRILSWNCSGLTQVLFEELKLHLRLHPCIQVVCLQETHRAFLNEWTADGWTFIHSAAAKAHQGGVLLGFRDTFCSKESLRWQEVHPGRMLHVRCFAQDQHLDFIGLYQHVLPFDSKELEKALVKRRQLWGKLDSLLQSFPLRSSVVVAGDFNSNLCSNGSCIGHSVLHNSAKKSVIEERLWLSGMLASHQLAALNSWSRKLPTYVHPSGSSQIDWILVRTALADRQAKQCVPKEAPLAGWRSSGHKMLQATVPLRWRPWKAAQQRERRSTHSSAAASEHNPQLQEVVQHVRDHVVPARQGVVRPGFVGADGEILRFWEARRLLATQSTRSMRDIFARMRLVLQLQRRRREMQAAIRFHKRKQLLDTLSLAEHSSRIGDSRSLYQCVRWLAPRGTRSTIRLRDAEGRLMHPKQECRMLAEYATELFQAKRVLDVPDIQLQPLDPAVFHPDQWFCAISSLRIGKAVPIGMPTVQQWKDCNASAASELSQIAIQSLCCDKPSIPQEWADVQLAWLAKAGKTPSRPQNLRSIGLMSVDCKAFLIVLRGAIAPYIEDTMRQHPQYAYRKGASTSDALMRAAGHCSSVRKLLQRHRSDHTAKILGEATVPLVGGLMCGIDLQKAFDALPHSEIHSGLLDAGVPDALAAAVVQVHLQTKCFVRHGGTEGVVSMTRGLRQGCPIAPIVYAAWSCRLCRLLDRRIVVSWSAEHCTLFADDIFSCWVLHTVKDFKDAVRELRSLIEALHALGMSVNFQKSIVVLRLCGKAVAALSKSYLVWRNGAQHLRLRCADCDMYIPCSTSMPYLGATLSYDNFELQTYKTRAQQAHARFQELRRVLRTNGAIACRHRVRIYKATVWPTLWYALSSVGLTVDVLKGVGSLLAGHLRKVLRVHEEGISNRAVLQRAGIDPRGFFLSQVKSKGESILHDSRRADHIKVQESQHCYHVYQRMLGFEDTPAMSTLTRVAKASLNMHIQRRRDFMIGAHLKSTSPKAIAQDQLDIDISAALQVEQLIPDSSKIKVHWQRSHPQEWASASADAIAGSKRWTFDTRQHDAAEFTATLLDGLALSHVHWEARRWLMTGIIRFACTRSLVLKVLCFCTWLEMLMQSNRRFGQSLSIMEKAWYLVTTVRSSRLPVAGFTLMIMLLPLRCFGQLNASVTASVAVGPTLTLRLLDMTSSDAPMNALEGSEEWQFYLKYKPEGFAMASGTPSEVSTAVTAEERDPKLQKLSEAKSGNGKGTAGALGSSGDGTAQQAPKRQHGSWGRKQDWTNAQWSRDWKGNAGSSYDNDEIKEMQRAISMMQRLALRHEDSINLMKLEFSFVAHMRLNIPASVVHMLYVAADGWRKLKAQEPQKLDRPMRTSLFVCFFAELKTRIQALDKRQDDVDKMAELGWLVKGVPVTWQFLKWDGATQRNVIDTTKPPLTNAEVLEHIDVLLANAVATNSLARFHPTRPLAEGMQGESIVFLIQVGNFGDACISIRSSLKALCHNAVLQLVATQLKTDRASRSTLANNIAASIRA